MASAAGCVPGHVPWVSRTRRSRAGSALARRAIPNISDLREPDFATLLRICELLETTPNDILGVGKQSLPSTSPEMLRQRIALAATVMDADTLRLAAEMMNALAIRTSRGRPDDP